MKPRKLLSSLSRCGWEALKEFYTSIGTNKEAIPGAVVAIQTFGDFPLSFHPHLHILVTDGYFYKNSMFSVSPAVDTRFFEHVFRHKVLKMLLSKGKITRDMISLLDKWRDALICRIGASRWFAIMDITVPRCAGSHGANGKSKKKMS